MTEVDFMLFLKLQVGLIQALPNPVRSFTNSGVLFPNSHNLYRKYIEGILHPSNLIFSLILNLLIDSSP